LIIAPYSPAFGRTEAAATPTHVTNTEENSILPMSVIPRKWKRMKLEEQDRNVRKVLLTDLQ
jgi:hypothetical protein